MNERPPLKPEWLDTWPVAAPSTDLEDRVWRGFDRRKRRARRGRRLGVATAAAAVLFVLWPRAERRESGPLVATGRTTWAIAGRAVAVGAEGSRLSWTHRSGATRVLQELGDVFYRVDPGGAFEVITPAGSVRVLGTCFRVEVKKMKFDRRVMISAGAASVVTAAVFVTVYEGRVALSDDRSLSAGESAVMNEDAPPPVPKSTIAMATAGAPARNSEPEVGEAQVRAQEARIEQLESELARLREAAQAPPPPPSAGAWPDDKLDERFDAEVRDEPWAAAKEELLQKRMVRYLEFPEDRLSVECRSHCCDVQLDVDDGGALGATVGEFKSSVGIGIGQSGWNQLDVTSASDSRDGLAHIYACNTRASGNDDDTVDRGLEREQLLARAAPALEVCRRSLEGPLEVELNLNVDRHGAISSVDTVANPVGVPATKCVEQALLSAARFAPAPDVTWFPVRVALAP